MSGTLFVVATPIGNLEDITARAVRILRDVALIAAEDTRRTARLLTRYGITTPTTSLHEHNEHEKSAALVAQLRRGDDVAIVSDAGTPTISDPGRRLIDAAISAGLRVEAIPGPNAVVAALAVSGFPAETFTFLGFPPTRANDRAEWFESLRTAGRTVVFFEAPHRIRPTLEELLSVIGDCEAAVARELTKVHEELVKGPITTILGRLRDPKGEYTVVVDIGRITDKSASPPASDADLLVELGRMTNNSALRRRQAINALAKRHHRSPNEVYEAVERARKSGK